MAAAATTTTEAPKRRAGTSPALTKLKAAVAAAGTRAKAAGSKAKVWSKTDKGKRITSGLVAAGAGAGAQSAADYLADEYPENGLFIALGLTALGVVVCTMADDPRILAAGGAVAGIGGAKLMSEAKAWMDEKEDEKAPATTRTGCPSDYRRLAGVRPGAPTPWAAEQSQRLAGVSPGAPTPQAARASQVSRASFR